MAHFNHLADQGYDGLSTDVSIAPPRPRKQRVKVAPILAKIGYWGGAFVGGFAAYNAGFTHGRSAAGVGLLVGIATAAVFGVIGLAIDGVVVAVD